MLTVRQADNRGVANFGWLDVAALSLPEMLILRKVVRWQALALFAGVLAVAFILVGWGFNAIVAAGLAV